MRRTLIGIAVLGAALSFITPSTSQAADSGSAPGVDLSQFALNGVAGTPIYKARKDSRISKFKISGFSSSGVTIYPVPRQGGMSWSTGQGNFSVTVDAGNLKTMFDADCTGFTVKNRDGDSKPVGFPKMTN